MSGREYPYNQGEPCTHTAEKGPMLIKRAPDIRSSEITDQKTYLNRREFIRAAGTTALAAAGALAAEQLVAAQEPAPHRRKLMNVKKSPLSTSEMPNIWEHITTYNNYYEFGTDKNQPAALAKNFKTEPWTIKVEGECAKPGDYHLEDILKGQA